MGVNVFINVYMRQVVIALLIGLLLPMAALADNREREQEAVFGRAQWIGALTRQQARLPEGRNYTGAKLKEPAVKAAWANIHPLADRSIWLRRDMTLKRKKVHRAEVFVCGLGFYELTVNGRKVGDSEFAPLWSDYDKSVFYNVYDVTSHLSPLQEGAGEASIQVLLGNGFYCEPGRRYAKMKIAFGPPTLLFRMHIEYADGTQEDVVSDASWQWTESPVVFNSIYGGEDYDARMEASPLSPLQEGPGEAGESGWRPVVIQAPPRGVLRRQIAEPVKIMERIGVRDTVLHTDSVLVFDMGQNLSGFPEITVQGKSGLWLRLIPGETLTKEGLVNQRQTGRPHYYTYTMRGNHQEVWHPRFSYYGYRYLQVEGDIEVLKKVESCFVYNAAQKTGSFECSNQLFNDAYRLIDRAIRSNWHSVWTDCPHREKLGWLEQDWLNGEGLVANYDCRSFIEQTLQNISDAQFDNGAVPEIAPNLCVFEGSWAPPFLESPEWGGALVALPYLYKEYYGDDGMISRYRHQMQRYADYLHTQDSCYILRQGLGDWYDYGPGRAGFAQNTPMPLVATAHYYWWNRLQGHPRADSIKAAFIREFYHPERYTFATGSQCAQAIALEMDLIPEGHREGVLQRLIDDIHQHGDRLTTGDVGNRYLFNALIHNGQQELLYKMLNHYEVPGYGYQIKLGHTTLTEQWNPEHGASMNHFMMGHVNNLLVPYILGIWREEGRAVIAPHPMGDITWCRGESNGIKAAWHFEGDVFVLDVEIPKGQTARICLPYSHGERMLAAGKHTLKEQINE